jgi:hypothetical protein
VEHRAGAGPAAYPDVAAVLLDDAVDGCKAEPGSAAFLLCGKERFEQVFPGIRIQSFAGVA